MCKEYCLDDVDIFWLALRDHYTQKVREGALVPVFSAI